MTSEPGKLDVIIVGAGPAGLSASLWCRDLGLRSLTIERGPGPGGQLNSIFNPINNYPGVQAGSGAAFLERFSANIPFGDETFSFGRAVDEVNAGDLAITLSGGERFSAKFLVAATGVRRRKLNIPGEDRFGGRGIISSGAKEKASAAGKVVAIVGGGDAAVENALILSENASRVFVIHRRQHFSARADLVQEAFKRPNVEFILETAVTAIDGSAAVEKIELAVPSGARTWFSIDLLLIRIGVEPNSDLFRGKAAIDQNGYLLTDHIGRTTVPNIFAVGDVANPVSPTIVSAAGTGATAIKAIAHEIGKMAKSG